MARGSRSNPPKPAPSSPNPRWSGPPRVTCAQHDQMLCINPAGGGDPRSNQHSPGTPTTGHL